MALVEVAVVKVQVQVQAGMQTEVSLVVVRDLERTAKTLLGGNDDYYCSLHDGELILEDQNSVVVVVAVMCCQSLRTVALSLCPNQRQLALQRYHHHYYYHYYYCHRYYHYCEYQRRYYYY